MPDVSQTDDLEKISMIDVAQTINEYIDQSDWRVKANANQGFSLGGLILNTAGKVTAKYWLDSVYPPDVANAHKNGDFHIHDIDFFCGYCAGWSLKSFLATGLNGVGGKIESGPPKHLSSAVGQMINFIGTMQNEWAGAQSFSSFDTYLAPIVKEDGLAYEEVKQFIQEFVFNLNVPSRWGNQSPFTNLTFDLVCPDDVKDEHPMIGGKVLDYTYGDLQKEMDIINSAFIDVMTEGDSKGRVFTFPIPTYNITKDFDWDSEIACKIFDMTAKYGTPYFQNFINSDLEPSMVRSMCLCGEEKILIRENGLFRKTNMEELYNAYAIDEENSVIETWAKPSSKIEALSLNPDNGRFEWVNIKRFLKTTGERAIYITTVDGRVMAVSEDHLVGVICEEGIRTKMARNITADDSVVVVMDGFNNFNEGLSLSVQKVKCVFVEEKEQLFYDIELDKNHYFVHSDGNITHNCCRLQLDLTQLKKRGNGLFGAGEQTGSIGVVTINAARIGYIAKTENELFDRLGKLINLAKISLEIKRETIDRLIENGFLPFTKRYLGSLRNHFSTIGINGVNECIRNFTNDEHDITTTYGKKFAEKLLDFMRDRITEIQQETGHMYNLEATPAEGATYRFAREDKKRYPEIIQEGTKEFPYYTNSTQLPVNYTSDLLYTLDHQESLQQKYTGGTVLHLYAAEKIPSGEICKRIIKSTFEHYKIPYITITPTFSICNIHGYLDGEQKTCPKCGEECEVWSRIVGYMRPVSGWNDGKKIEFKDRLKFNYRAAIESEEKK